MQMQMQTHLLDRNVELALLHDAPSGTRLRSMSMRVGTPTLARASALRVCTCMRVHDPPTARTSEWRTSGPARALDAVYTGG